MKLDLPFVPECLPEDVKRRVIKRFYRVLRMCQECRSQACHNCPLAEVIKALTDSSFYCYRYCPLFLTYACKREPNGKEG